MDKKELLKSVGFSNEFISHLERVENEDLYSFQIEGFSNENLNLSVHDSSELYMEKQLKRDFSNGKIMNDITK